MVRLPIHTKSPPQSRPNRTTGYAQAVDQLRLSEAQGKIPNLVGLMHPTGPALNHPAAHTLIEFGTQGCPVNCGAAWTREQLQAAVDYAAHPSARLPEAAKYLQKETMEKVNQGYARLVEWDAIKGNPPEQLKIAPIAAIPHKTRHFRAILDLSFLLKGPHAPEKSVNKATTKLSHEQSLDQLGKVLPRLFQLLAWAPGEKGPLMFQKLDIKDGYWRCIVEEGAEWNFCFVLPKVDPNEPTKLVVPTCLQMGWTESPGYFCMCSETGRDVSEQLAHLPIGSLPQHESEHLTLGDLDKELATLEEPLPTYNNPKGPDWLPPTNQLNPLDFAHLMDVYVDDFMQAAQTTDPAKLQHLSRAMLHGIHSVFPPPRKTGHDGQDPIHQKKAKTEGSWEFVKEILGWMFDGINRCVYLPDSKIDKLRDLLKTLKEKNYMELTELMSIRGKLQHATYGMPGATPLMGPFHAALRDPTPWVTITPEIKLSVKEFKYMLKRMQKTPTQAIALVNDMPHYIGTHDASGKGAGGVWFGGACALPPTVWRVEWPQDIQDNIVGSSNPTGKLSVNDLELAAAIIQLLVLEAMILMTYITTFTSCDNTPTVSWVNKRSSSRSKVATQLLKIWGSRMVHGNIPPPCIHYLPGKVNTLSDRASRVFKTRMPSGNFQTLTDHEFLTKFNVDFPFPQNTSWRICRLNTDIISRVFAVLRMEPCMMASWQQVTKTGNAFGTIASNTANSLDWTPDLQTALETNALSPWSLSPSELEMARIPPELVSKCKQSNWRLEQSARPSNWMEKPTPATN